MAYQRLRPITEEQLAAIESRLKPFREAESRSQRLAPTIPKAKLFVAVCGIEADFDSYELLDDFAFFRRVTNPPGVVHIAGAADLNRADYLAVSRYSLAVRAEVAVGNPHLGEEHNQHDFLLDLAWHLVALVKLRGQSTLFCPAVATASWDLISGIRDNTVLFQILDDVPRQITFTDGATSVSLEDMEWIKQHWDAALDLRDFETSRRFGLAFNIMYTWNQNSDIRVAMANVWAGLEALFGERSDRPFSHNLAKRISDWLPHISQGQVRELYSHRCDAVHGRWLGEHEIGEALRLSWSLLAEALIKCIETRSQSLPDWR